MDKHTPGSCICKGGYDDQCQIHGFPARERATRLRDAAPDMAKALQDLLPLAEWALMETSPPGIDQPKVDAARAALKKAGL